MRRRTFLGAGLGLAAALGAGCIGRKTGRKVDLAVPTRQLGLVLVDWGFTDEELRVKVRNDSSATHPGDGEAWLARCFDRHGDAMGPAIRFRNGQLPPYRTETFALPLDDIDLVGSVILSIVPARRS